MSNSIKFYTSEVFYIIKLQKTDFYHIEHQKRKDKICPFSRLAAFHQPTTVDKDRKKTSGK